MAKTIYVLNGPNLDLSGTGEPGTCGAARSDIDKLCAETAEHYGLSTDCLYPAGEDELIDFIRQAHARKAVGIVVNADGYACGSVATALMAAKIPTVEVQNGQLSDRDDFRHHSFTASPAFASLCGFGIDGYRLAITSLAARIGAKAAA